MVHYLLMHSSIWLPQDVVEKPWQCTVPVSPDGRKFVPKPGAEIFPYTLMTGTSLTCECGFCQREIHHGGEGNDIWFEKVPKSCLHNHTCTMRSGCFWSWAAGGAVPPPGGIVHPLQWVRSHFGEFTHRAAESILCAVSSDGPESSLIC